jgi:hypothetical protein
MITLNEQSFIYLGRIASLCQGESIGCRQEQEGGTKEGGGVFSLPAFSIRFVHRKVRLCESLASELQGASQDRVFFWTTGTNT